MMFAVLAITASSTTMAQSTVNVFTSFEPDEGIVAKSPSISLLGGLLTFSDEDGLPGPGNEGEPNAIDTKDVSDENDDGTATQTGDFILAINGARTPNTASPNVTLLEIDFAQGATEVSFFAFNDGNGLGNIDVFGVDGTLLDNATITNSDGFNGVNDFFSFSADGLGQLIGSVEVGNTTFNANGPYIGYLDDFSATVAVPEPTSIALLGITLLAGTTRRRKS